ncbi:MAG: CPBP family intramembrane glutamic endopeptidase, BDIM_20840 family [Sphingomicrobium sp.]
MSDGLFSALTIFAGLLVAGLVLGALGPRKFRPNWLLVSGALFLLNDAALTRCYGLFPNILPGEWNWQGKLLALAITLVIAATPWFGFRRSGLTLKQDRRGFIGVMLVSVLLLGLFTWFALGSDDGKASVETIAFQLTMPGLEEEPFYRGILLLALNKAFLGRIRMLGIDWGLGALISSALFGLAHAFGYSDGAYSFDLMTFALTGGPALVLVWIRERTGSLLLPILLHNFGNSIGLFI